MAATEQDPFAIFHTPPPNETVGERAARLRKEAEAKHISDQIDEQLKVDRLALKKQKNIVRVLLLGQSKSGKSTTLKTFRMMYARAAWDAERASWRAVIQLNLVRSIIAVVETLQAEMDGGPIGNPVKVTTPIIAGQIHHAPNSSSAEEPSSSAVLLRANMAALSTLLIKKHQLLMLRLGELRRVEANLKQRLGEAPDDVQDGAADAIQDGAMDAIPDGSVELFGPLCSAVESQALSKPNKESDVLKLPEALKRSASAAKWASWRKVSQHGHEGDGEPASPRDPVDEATEILASCHEDVETIWSDEAVKAVLREKNLETAGFFLDDLHRIVRRDYEPSDDDILRARLRTAGVQEYRIRFETSVPGSSGIKVGEEWLLYDICGSRTMRHAWVPFFDNVQAIIFHAPVSCFNECLPEDPKVNRLEDSLQLWRIVCSSRLLSNAMMILFLNKCDLLRKKLKSGVQMKDYLPSFGERRNDVGTVVKYLQENFKAVLRQNSPTPRSSYFYVTSSIDTRAIALTITTVKDGIYREYLAGSDLL